MCSSDLLTTFLVVVILYFLGGVSIHGFAFSLVIGVVVGTYSSIFIAAPTVVWMQDKFGEGSASSASSKKKVTATDR